MTKDEITLMKKKYKGKRYLIRDIDTKKSKFTNNKICEFNSLDIAINFIGSMNFGLGNFYEIWDKKNKKVAYKKIKYERGLNI